MASASKYNGVHKQQLFHWLAARADRAVEMKGRLTPLARRGYIECLAGSLEKGIWVKPPRKPEEIRLRKHQISLGNAMACFTEWSLNDSLKHTREYGRMAFGFSKSWLIKHGGQPVTYYDHSANSPFLKSLIALLKNPPKDKMQLEALLYLVHFTKRIHKPSKLAGTPPAPKPPAAKPVAPVVSKHKLPPDKFARFWSKTMPFLEEREWRIVEHSRLEATETLVPNSKYRPNSNRPSEMPKFYLPYKPGEDLFTLVLPDNQTVSAVLQNTWFTNRLFPKNGPHVTVLSLQDIGTF